MKITLHLAISADGFIAQTNGDSDWVSKTDERLFIQRAQKAGCVVVGRKTFDQYRGDIYPISGALTIVLSRSPGAEIPNVVFAGSPIEAVTLAQKNGFSEIVLAGGAQTSTAFLEANVIDAMFFTVHPIILGQGIKPFEGMTLEKALVLLGTRTIETGLVELHYRVLD